VAINGIVGFMLTPGDWLTTGALFDAFFHPTYWSSLVFRTGICLLLAGIWAMLLTIGVSGAGDRARLVRRNAVWSLLGFLVVAPSALWYWYSVPGDLLATALASAAAPATSLRVLLWVSAALAVVLLAAAALPRRFGAAGAVLAMMLALDFFGSFEWLRESARKPFVVHGHLYANSVEVARVEELQRDGMLPHLAYRTGDDGADLFRYACRSCHTWKRYRPLEPVLAGADAEFLTALVAGADLMRGNMPPFAGTAREAAALGEHLAGLAARTSLAELTGATGTDLGEHVFRQRCGTCHEFGGVRDNRESLVGLDRDEIEEILDAGSDFDDRMPDFTGTDEEREALIAWMLALPEAQP
jgi:mono/diheme cytochrome c family protein